MANCYVFNVKCSNLEVLRKIEADFDVKIFNNEGVDTVTFCDFEWNSANYLYGLSRDFPDDMIEFSFSGDGSSYLVAHRLKIRNDETLDYRFEYYFRYYHPEFPSDLCKEIVYDKLDKMFYKLDRVEKDSYGNEYDYQKSDFDVLEFGTIIDRYKIKGTRYGLEIDFDFELVE